MKLTIFPFTFLSFFLLPLLVSASHGEFKKRQIGSARQATTAEVEELMFYSSLSADVYCPAVVPGGTWICPNCAKARHLEIVDTFTTIAYDTNVLVARGDTDKTIYVVFRGSVSLQNWLADLTAIPVPYSGVTGATVHVGFLQSYKDVQKKLIELVNKELVAHPGYTVAVSGHSLGGATALLCALDLYEQGVNVKLYTQGQPRTGNKKFAEYVVKTGIPYKRAVHASDPVPHVPDTLLGFYHAGEEFWDNRLRVVACPNGLETNYCSGSLGVGLIFTDHTSYFGMSTGICL
ncbi:catalysis At the Interface: the anatomy of A conformational change in A triglyceride lipase [Phascolomyces articulosus]|uniref:Catalysis At the Interface: the anatomy of A conformational change in A triglyceride lipase n=1 Tax=Phascolomyces articulosus TaxID=60185 RepID=A0AAD5K421_9FUNG|nr:catalysis At the Interface: the anatomy of A conformational change in A triglyceride lipase [Phascolomyces articulosus]